MKNVTRALFSGLVILLGQTVLSAQDWREPLADPGANFYTIQSNFYAEWGAREQQNAQARQDQTLLNNKFAYDDPANPTPFPYMKGGYKQFKRWEYFMEPRVYPSGDLTLPSSNYERFVQYLDSDPVAMTQYVQTYGAYPIGTNMQTQRTGGPVPNPMSSTWTFMGPTGYPANGGAGRVNVIRFDPQFATNNTMYAGAPAGGLWKSTNGGTTWAIVASTDAIASIGVTDIAIDPTNSNTIYIATGDGDAGDTYSIGVLKSIDGGLTWTNTMGWTTNQGRTISRLLINSTNPQILMAFGNTGIWRTTNGGGSWTQVQNTYAFRDAEFKPGDVNTIYASGTRFVKSTNAGATWTQVTTGLPANTSVDRMSIAVTPANSAYVYILAGSAANNGFYGVYRSTDSGTTFSTRSTTPNIMGWASAGNDTGGQSWYDHGFDASQTNADVVVVGGVNHWRSTNGGTNWTLNAHWTGSGAPYVHADVHCIVFAPGSGTRYFSGNDGGINETTNSGGAWSDRSAQLCIAQPYRIGLSASNANLWLTGHQDNGTNRFNGSWSEVMGGDGMDCFIDRTNNNTMYAEYYNGSFNRSTNGGTTWTGITTGLSGASAWVTPWCQDPVTANTLWAGYSQVFRSTNQGTNWTQMGTLTGSGTIVDIKVAPSNNAVIYAARSNQLWKSVNTGGAWTNVTGTLPVASAAISRICIDPADPNNVWVTFSGYSSANKIFVTTNGGTSWTNITTGLPNVPANCVVYTPGSATDAIYVGMDVGVYYRDNTTGAWAPYFTGLPNVPIFDLEIYAATSKVRAASFGRGVWEVDVYNPGTLAPIADFSANQTLICPGASVNFTDMSSFTPTSWNWSFQGGTPSTSTAQNPTGITWSTPGTYSVTLTATNANGSDAETKTAFITVMSAAVAPPLVEGFVSATFLPTNWTANNINNDGVFWDRSTTAGIAPTAGNSARFDNYNLDAAGARDEMWCPRQTLASMSTCSLTFDVAYARYNATYTDTLEVMVSTDCGTTWTQVWIKGGTTLATAPDQTTQFTPTSAQWRAENISLNTFCGQASVLIKFVNHGRYGNCLFVDNVNIAGTVAALPSATFTASATSVCAGTPVNFTSTSSGSPTSWTWTFPSGTPASATTQNVTGVVWNTAGTYTVTHTATNVNGTGTQTTVITVLASPTVTTTTSGGTICNGSSTTLTGSGASTYNWMPGSLTGSPVTVSPTATTTYTVTGTGANGCTSTATRTITVNANPTVTTTSATTTICSGGSTTLTATGASTYNWMPGSLTGSPVTVSPTTTTTYTVTGTAANGCTATATRTITVNPSPTVAVTSSTTTVCAGSSVTLTGSGASTYSWMPGSLTGTSVGVSPTSTTTYTVTGTGANGCTSTATQAITVNPTPAVTATSATTTICSGNSTTLSATGASTYNWMPGSLTGSPVTVSPATTTTYTVTGTGANGCTSTATRTITVNPTPTVTVTTSTATVCSGGSATLTASGATTYSWMPGSLTGTSVSVSPTSATTYTVTGTSGGCTSTATQAIAVNASPTVTASSSTTTICSGSPATLTATGGTSYTWMPGSLTGSPVTVTPATSTTYTVTGTAANGCTATATQAITVNATPTVTATATNNSICTGGNTTITGGGASTYLWMPGSLTGTSITVTPATSTTYTVTGTGANGCANTQTIVITVGSQPTVTVSSNTTLCSGSSTTLSASGTTTYNWMPGNLSGSSVTVSPTSTTTYTVTGTNAPGCSNTATVMVTVNPVPTVTATASTLTVCSGSPTTLTGAGASTYLWMPGSLTGSSVVVSPTANTTYTVTGTDVNGCTDNGTIAIAVAGLPSLNVTPTATTICQGGTVALNASPTGNSTFSWSPTAGLSAPNLPATNASPTSTTTYVVTRTNNTTGCSRTATVVVTVNPAPAITASASSTTICTGNPVTLTGTGASTYNWMPGNLNGSSVTVNPVASTTYTVTGTDINGCTGTQTIAITVGSQPTVTASSSSPSVCDGSSATLSASGTTSYTWMPGNLTGSSVIVTPNVTTTYTVTGDNGPGCSNTATITVTVNSLPTVGASTSVSTICPGDVVTLTGSGAASYDWMPGSLSGSPVTDAPTSSITYTVTGTDVNGCSNTSTISIAVNTPPAVSVVLMNDTFCDIDGPTALSGGSPAGGTYSGPGVSGNAFDASSVGSGTYTITYTFTDVNGCSDSASQTVIVDICNGLPSTPEPIGVMQVVPNPNEGEFVLTFNIAAADDYILEIHNALGQIVYAEQLNSFSGQYSNKINLSEHGRGAYTIRLRSSTNEIIERVITF